MKRTFRMPKAFKRTLAMLLAFLMAASVFVPVSQVSASEVSGSDIVIVTESDVAEEPTQEECVEETPVEDELAEVISDSEADEPQSPGMISSTEIEPTEPAEQIAESATDASVSEVAEALLGTSSAIASGTCGTKLTWTLGEYGVLKISGTGAMTDWDDFWETPWCDYSEDIENIIISDGVTSIGENAFAECYNLYSAVIPDTVTSIGTSAFSCCEYVDINYIGSEEDWYDVEIGDDNYCVSEGYITFFEQKVTGMSVEPTEKLVEGFNGYYWEEYDPDTDELISEYFEYSIEASYPEVTLTFEDGTTETFNAADSLLCPYNISFYTDQSADNTWDVGTHTATAYFLGLTCDFEVEIIENPVESISVEPKRALVEGIDGMYDWGWDEETEEDAIVFVYDFFACGFTVTVYYTDGTSAVYDYDEIEAETGFDIEIDSDLNYEPGGVGTYASTATYMDVTCDFEIEVVENSIESISATATYDLIKGISCDEEWDYDTDISYDYYDVKYVNPVITVNYSDGTSADYAYDDNQCFMTRYLLAEDDQSYDNVWGIGEHTYSIRFMEEECELDVEVIDNPYIALSISGDKQLYLTFTKKDGTTEKHTARSFEYYSYLDDETGIYGTLITDKGAFHAVLNVGYEYDEELDENIYTGEIAVQIGSMKSNKLTSCDWYSIQEKLAEKALIIMFNQNLLENTEISVEDISKDNIDDIINIATHLSGLCYGVPDGRIKTDAKGYYYYMEDADVVAEDVAQFFAVDEIDLTMAKGYDSETDKVKVYLAEGIGGDVLSNYCVYEDNQWKFNGTMYYYLTSAEIHADDDGRISYLKLSDEAATGGEDDSETENIIDSGTCGENLTWKLDQNGTLTISGTGAMTDWEDTVDTPWYEYCSSVKNVVIGDSVTSIGDWAFYDYQSLTGVTIGDSVTSIGYRTFSFCGKLENVTISESVATIGDKAFSYCESLTIMNIPDSTTSIGVEAFYECTSLEEVVIGDGVTRICGYAFRNCEALESVTMGDNVAFIGTAAFGNCTSLDNVIIPDKVTTIIEDTFLGCSSLTSITIGSGLTTIQDYAFMDCSSLTDVYFNGTETEWNKIKIGEYFNDDLLSATIHFVEPESLYKLTASPESSQDFGTPITLTATGGAQYKFYYEQNGKWITLQSYSASNTCVWTPTEARDYLIFCDVKDADGNVVAILKLNYTVTDPYTFTLDKENVQDVGVNMTLTAAGGESYKFYYEYNGAWCSITSNTTGICEWSPKFAGNYMLYVDIKDADGNVITCRTQAFTLNDPFAVYCDAESTEMPYGYEINFTAEGGAQYKFYYEKNGAWVRIQDFSETATCTWTPTAAGVYNVYVDIKDDSGAVVSCKRITFNITNPYSFTADKDSEQEVGTKISFTAEGGYQYKFYYELNGTWVRIQSYSTSNTCSWTPSTAGRYNVYVDIADESGNLLAYKSMEFVIGNVTESYSFTTSVESPQPMNTSVTLTAAGGSSYKFYYEIGGKWATIQNFSTTNTCTWTPDMIDTYKLYVDIKDASGNVVKTLSKSFTATDPYGFTVSKTSPQDIGTTVTLTANGGNSYKFYYQYQGAWVKIQDSTTGTCDWRPNKAGTYLLYVDIKNASGTVVTCRTVEITFNDPFSFTTTASSLTQPTGTAISLAADGGESYKFYYELDGAWVRIQNFSTDDTCTWTPTQPGKYNLFCDIKDASGSVAVCKRITFNITERCTISADKTTAELGEKITLTATGGAQYKFYYELDGAWVRIQSYSTSDTCQWTPTTAGDYMVYVDIQDENGTVIACKGVQIVIE